MTVCPTCGTVLPDDDDRFEAIVRECRELRIEIHDHTWIRIDSAARVTNWKLKTLRNKVADGTFSKKKWCGRVWVNLSEIVDHAKK